MADNGKISRICEDRALSIAELESELMNFSDGEIMLVGDGANICFENMKQIESIKISKFCAIASSVETDTQGFPKAMAIPFTHETPILTPVNEPGPALAAKTSISLISVLVNSSSFSARSISV